VDIRKAALHVYFVKNGVTKAICWIRGELSFDEEGNESAQIWAHGMEPLAVCRIDEGEDALDTLQGAIEERVGGAFLDDMEDLTLKNSYVFEGCAHWHVVIELDFLVRMAMLSVSSGGFRFIDSEELRGIVDLESINPTHPVSFDVNAMLLDELHGMKHLWPKAE